MRTPKDPPEAEADRPAGSPEPADLSRLHGPGTGGETAMKTAGESANSSPDPPVAVSVVLVPAGFQLVAVGLLAMLVARVYHHVAGRHTCEVRRGAGRTGTLPTTPPEAAPPSRRNGGRQGG